MLNVSITTAETLFQTPEFRESPFVQGIAREVGTVFVTTDPEPPGHFGAFFGFMLDPDAAKYPNPYIRDLRRLHDLTHLLCWKRQPFPANGTFFEWTKRMIDAEIYASLVTECYIYFKIPGLRDRTFGHEIWVDRFLRDPYMKVLTPMAEYRIAAARLHAMTSPDPTDLIELGIANYLKQNREWCVLFGNPTHPPFSPHPTARPAFRIIEDHMREVYAGNMSLADHRAWLSDWSGLSEAVPGYHIPFLDLAMAFEPIYRQTGRESGISLLRA